MAGDGAHDLVNECNFLQAGAVRSGCLYDMGGCQVVIDFAADLFSKGCPVSEVAEGDCRLTKMWVARSPTGCRVCFVPTF